jgi:hypothetical protein
MLSVVMLTVIMLSVIMLNVVMLSVIMLIVIVLNVTMLNVITLSVIILNVIMLNIIMLSDNKLNVIMLNVFILIFNKLNVFILITKCEMYLYSLSICWLSLRWVPLDQKWSTPIAAANSTLKMYASVSPFLCSKQQSLVCFVSKQGWRRRRRKKFGWHLNFKFFCNWSWSWRPPINNKFETNNYDDTVCLIKKNFEFENQRPYF